MSDNIRKIEQFKKQVLAVRTDYTALTKNNVNSILDTINNKIVNHKNSETSTCHGDSHYEHGGHHDSHSDTHPDCAKREMLGDMENN